MKQYVIVIKNNSAPKVVSSNSLLYSEYMMSGYEVIYSGNQKECENYKEEMILEMSNMD